MRSTPSINKLQTHPDHIILVKFVVVVVVKLHKIKKTLSKIKWSPTALLERRQPINSSLCAEIGKKAWLFAKLQPGRARKRINAT